MGVKTITDLVELTVVADDDLFLVYDTSTSASKKILKSNLAGNSLGSSGSNLTIDGTSPLSLSGQAISLKNDAAAAITEVDTGTLADSDTVVPTSKAVKTYVDKRAVYYSSDYDSLYDFVDKISTTSAHLIINRNETVSETTEIKATVAVEVLKGCVITVATSKTLTINGPFNANLCQVFSCTGTGAVAFGAGAVSIIYPEWWGENTTPGTTDMTAEIQAALTAGAAIGCKVYLCGQKYKISSTLTLVSDNTLEANGAQIDMSGFAGTKYGVAATGSLSDSEAITSGASALSYVVAVADATGIAADDFILITSDDHYPYSTGDYNVDFGEVVQVREVDGTDIYLTTPLMRTYATNPVIRTVAWVKNVHIKGIKLTGSYTADTGEFGIRLFLCNRFSVKDCVVEGIDYYGISAIMSILGEISGNTIWGVFYDGVTGMIFYGIVILNASRYINITNNRGHRNRHLVVTTATTTSGYYGQPSFINVTNNIAFDSEAGDGGRSFAFENHGFGQHIVWANNEAHGCYAGFRIENGDDNLVTGNIINNYAFSGIILGGSGKGATNLVVSNNVISYMTNERAGAAAILVESAGTYKNLSISGNTIRNPYNSTADEIAIALSANTYVNTTVSGNSIYTDNDSTMYAIYCATNSHNLTIEGNFIYGFRNGIAMFGNRCLCRGNTIRNTEVKASGYGVFVDGTLDIVQGNTCYYIVMAWRVGEHAVTAHVLNNQDIDCTGGVSIHASATGTVSRDNDSA